MNQEDEEIRLRDQYAIAAMGALISKYGVFGQHIEGEGYNMQGPFPRAQRLTTAAYIIADEMRKARLKSFT